MRLVTGFVLILTPEMQDALNCWGDVDQVEFAPKQRVKRVGNPKGLAFSRYIGCIRRPRPILLWKV